MFSHQFSGYNLKSLDPRRLGIIILVSGLLLGLIAFFPISQVFSRQWKLNQKIDLVDNFVFDFQAMGISSLTSSLGLDPIIPVGTISIRFYALCIFLGILAGYALALYLSKWHFIASTVIDRLIIGLIIFGLLGARLFFVIFHWDLYAENPLDIITDIPSGGLAIFGMLIADLIYLWLYCNRFKFNIFEFLDFLAPSVLIGQIIGRFGNFFNYEAYGPETSVFWKMYVPEAANFYGDLNAKYFHPTFLYEIIPNFLLLVLMLWNYQKWTDKHAGLVFASYAVGYGIIRFITEFFRLDALIVSLPENLHIPLGPITVSSLYASQIAAAILFFVGVFVYFRRKKVIYLKRNMMELSI